MHDRIETAFEVAKDADTWEMSVEFGAHISMFSEGRFDLAARYFNTLAHFLPPDEETPSWRVALEQLDGTEPEHEELGQVTVAQVIDVVPYVAEESVLTVTREAVDYFTAAVEEGGEEGLREDSLRLTAELEQGEAHSAAWQQKAASRYGLVVMYDFRKSDTLSYELGTEGDRPALYVSSDEMPSMTRVLVAPDTHNPWRWTDPGHLDDYGERYTVEAALDRAGADHTDWVREQTALALGDTLGALRSVQDRALTGRDPDALAELGRLAGHAQTLAEGLHPPLVAE